MFAFHKEQEHSGAKQKTKKVHKKRKTRLFDSSDKQNQKTAEEPKQRKVKSGCKLPKTEKMAEKDEEPMSETEETILGVQHGKLNMFAN